MRRLAVLLVVLCLPVVLSACGSAEKEVGETSPASQPPQTPTAEVPAEPVGSVEELVDRIGDDLNEAPEIPPSTGAAPDELVTEDIVDGEGTAADQGDTIAVNYVGAVFETGVQFDSSFERGEPFSFPLGSGQVIPGWDEGLVGMKEGGRRVLVIPPDMAYGEQGSPPDIPPNATLVFVVDLVKVGA